MSGTGSAGSAPLRKTPGEGSLAELYIRTLGLSLIGYALLGRSFAYVGVPPLFVGELLVCVGLLVMFRTGCVVGTLAAVPNLLLLALGAWTLARTVPFLSVHGMDALRDAVVVLYGAFAFILCALLIERPARLDRSIKLFGRFAAAFGATAGIAYAMQQLLGNRGLLPLWPNSGLPLIAVKPGDVAVHLAGSAVFGLLFFRRISIAWIALLITGMAMVGVHSRGGMLAMVLPLGVALALSGRVRQLAGVLLAGCIVVVVAFLLDLDVSMIERERSVSVEQVVENFTSIFGDSANSDLDGTKAWRLLWWQAIVDYTLHGPYFWTGKGFGIALASADGFDGVTPPGAPELRSPHNISMTMLARAGVPGLALWLLLLLAWFGMMVRNIAVARARSDQAWFKLFLFIACYLAAALINASFDVALEGPMLGIWFWVLFGIGVGATQIYRTQRSLVALRPAAPSWPRAVPMATLLWALLAAGAPGASAAEPLLASQEPPCPASAMRLPPGADLAAIVGRAPDGTVFCLGRGVHRMQTVTPRDRQAFHGEPGAILNGARLVSGFVRDGRHWVASGQDQRGWQRPDVPCAAHRPRCGFPEAVFIDDRPLFHASSRAEVGEDSFFLDYETRRLYVGSNPAGRRVEASVAPAAFIGGARGVLIAGLVIEKYASAAQAGAIGLHLKPVEWTVRNNEVRLNSAIGVMVGARSRVLHNRIHGNGNMGAGCGGEDVLFQDNEISRNGYFRGIDTLWEGGGVKCAQTTRLTFRRNRVEANNGIGLWTDIDNLHTLYEGNLVLRNVNSGISHEISYDAVIRGNYLDGNGDGFHVWLWGGAIQVQNSRNVLVQGNLIVAHQGNGISLIQQDRGTGRHGPWVTTGNQVVGNVVIATLPLHGRSGAVADHDRDGMRNGHNIFRGNAYHVADPGAAYWAWTDGWQPWAGYRASSGQDADSTLSVMPARDPR
ncbi:right-handed parallel beta-helix repeat-containing protein [Falsiroseomonas oryzae]|uniref:right-handed parallel beta-helix repeat-containing protein n=1 Tax=Falsiroseomonas oryzae TaxID=2766473 RepID=UPI0022EB310B|nr:right-handed parallel beta-helix repeat-containing protein [Roseomonas sp. MO-31]